MKYHDTVESDRIIEILDEIGASYTENPKTIYTECPVCNKRDKFSILKANGHSICYHGGCNYGKGWFPYFVAKKLNIPVKEAREKIFSDKDLAYSDSISLGFIDHDAKQQKVDEPVIVGIPISWPPSGCSELRDSEAIRGLKYLEDRGIDIELAEYYGIVYNPHTDRIIYPIVSDGYVFGWQARAVDKNEVNKMLNNPGFEKSALLMFADSLKSSDHAIICEGPVDAIKFHKCGGAVCTMGKAVSNRQLAMISMHKPKSIFLALDDDAADETNALVKKLSVPVFKVEIPESCKQRCKRLGKKADFGECTLDECVSAFNSAIRLDGNYWVAYLKED